MRAILTFILILIMHGQTSGQAGPAGEADPAIKVNVDLVNVLCNVYDKRGALVNDLNRADFEVREDGKQQQLRYFARETNLPLTVALLVDVSGSVRRFVELEKDTAGRFFKEILRPEDKALLIGFGSRMILWQDFTSSAPDLE